MGVSVWAGGARAREGATRTRKEGKEKERVQKEGGEERRENEGPKSERGQLLYSGAAKGVLSYPPSWLILIARRANTRSPPSPTASQLHSLPLSFSPTFFSTFQLLPSLFPSLSHACNERRPPPFARLSLPRPFVCSLVSPHPSAGNSTGYFTAAQYVYVCISTKEMNVAKMATVVQS